jgi:hypothetical protein
LSVSTLNEHQTFEQAWWFDCANTYGEETKQLTYANRMGLTPIGHGGHWPVYDLEGKSVVDLGGGPVSMLLKTINGARLSVVDPCSYPEWIAARYEAHGISYFLEPAENRWAEGYDECWIYNVLQHVEDPKAVIASAIRAAPVLRLFEWLEMPASIGHPHTLHLNELNEWIGRNTGGIETMNENGCVGLAYYGVFE